MARVYEGQRTPACCIVVVYPAGDLTRTEDLPRTARPGRRYPGGWEWGYGGTGPHQLAWDLLLHATGQPTTAAQLYRLFCIEVISRLHIGRWTLTQAEILAWVAEHPAVLIV